VFRDMFGLFSSDDNSQRVRKKRKNSGVLVLPDANTTGDTAEMRRLKSRER
jgi:hypothetical protein